MLVLVLVADRSIPVRQALIWLNYTGFSMGLVSKTDYAVSANIKSETPNGTSSVHWLDFPTTCYS